VIGFSETMLKFPEMYDGVPLPGEYERDLQQIYTSGAQLLHVINDILDLSRVDAGKLDVQYGRVDLDPIFKATQTTAVGLIGDKPIKLVRNLPAELPAVWADANRVRQIMLNLYSNAVKFTDEGAITLGLKVLDGHVEISVTDTGCGVDEDEIELIFEEFRQGRAGRRKQNTGSGLGLSISRHLGRLMGGRIWAESEVGVGSTFTFTLPLADSADDTLARRSLSSQPALQ
jgi:signal transduction histidine kinase